MCILQLPTKSNVKTHLSQSIIIDSEWEYTTKNKEISNDSMIRFDSFHFFFTIKPQQFLQKYPIIEMQYHHWMPPQIL